MPFQPLRIDRNLLQQALRNPEVVRQIELLIRVVSEISPEIGDVTAALTNNTGRLMDSNQALDDGAGAATATLNNAPVAGDPTKWVEIDDNGTVRYIPAW